MLVDGNSAEKIREVLEVDNHTYEQLRFQSARVWESAAGYAPTIGILGAVLGLIHVMQTSVLKCGLKWLSGLSVVVRCLTCLR